MMDDRRPHNVSSLIRATIFVADLGRATAFYHALGLTEVYYAGVLDDASATAILGFAQSRPLPVRIVKRPGPNYGMIGLFRLDPALRPDRLPAPTGSARVGEVALVFYVSSMDDALERLRNAGASWSPEPQVFRMPHRAQREVCLRDPDGVLLNLVETDPDEQNAIAPEGGR